MTLLEKIIKTIHDRKAMKSRVIARKPDEDFIPYVCHYNKNTILTKNGELLQIIRVTGLSQNDITLNLSALRDNVRDAIYDNVKNKDFAFWFHTIRRKKSVISPAEFSPQDVFAQEINQKWNTENKLDSQFVNELYITIIHEGLENSIKDFNSVIKSLSYKATQRSHKEHLRQSCDKLNDLTKKILLEIEDYGAKILGIEEYEGVLYSQPMRFFGKITNLAEERYPLSVNDISDDLANHKIAFGNREVEVLSGGTKNFASMLSIKEYHEVSIDSLDKILNLPFEFIITQTFDFIYDKKEVEPYQYRKHILEVSDDDDFAEIAGFNNFFESDTGRETDYGKIQTSLTIIAQNLEDLEHDVVMAVEKFSELGFVIVREDVFSEHCFWSQLPANFSFLRRQKLINTLRVGGFAALSNFPSGSIAGNHWGSALTTFKTIIGTPYFFSLHEQDLGHSIIIGPEKSGKTTIANFLITQAQKFNCKVFYFDTKKSSKPLIKALGGSYYSIQEESDGDSLKMNPFSLPAGEENAAFLTHLLLNFCESQDIRIDDQEAQEAFEIVQNVLFSGSANFLSTYEAMKNGGLKNICSKLKILTEGRLSYIFESHNEINWNDKNIGFDLDHIRKQKLVLTTVIAYLLFKIESQLDGNPTIIVLDESFKTINDQFFLDYFKVFLENLRKKNCLVIFSSRAPKDEAGEKIAKIIYDNCATEIYLADEEPIDTHQEIFQLTDDEISVLKFISQERTRHALLKQSGDSLILDIDLSFFEEILPIFSANKISGAALEELQEAFKQENPDQDFTPEKWLKQFKEIMQEVKKSGMAV